MQYSTLFRQIASFLSQNSRSKVQAPPKLTFDQKTASSYDKQCISVVRQGTETPPKTLFLAKICANCTVYSIWRSRSIERLRHIAKKVEKEADNPLWTQNMVEAAIGFQKIFSSRTYCHLEKTHVGLFEPACANFKPAREL